MHHSECKMQNVESASFCILQSQSSIFNRQSSICNLHQGLSVPSLPPDNDSRFRSVAESVSGQRIFLSRASSAGSAGGSCSFGLRGCRSGSFLMSRGDWRFLYNMALGLRKNKNPKALVFHGSARVIQALVTSIRILPRAPSHRRHCWPFCTRT